MKRPLLICMTATRNYGWVTSAFLKANSQWADYIIIADQHSTDGTREIALQYPNVILLDNNDLEYSETKRSEMVINRAREIEGDKILIFLAIDEILSANYFETSDWQKILHSNPGDVFFFYWANLCPDSMHYWISKDCQNKPSFMTRMFHDDGITPYDNEGIDMHTHCIPYPKVEKGIFYVNDFAILHFGDFNEKWNIAKQRFYQFVDFDKNNRNITTLSRMYQEWKVVKQELQPLPKDWIYTKNQHGFDLFLEVDVKKQQFFDQYVLNFIKENGIERYMKLDVWDKVFLEEYKMIDPRSFFIKIIHFYFHITNRITNLLIIRVIDKILKKSGL